MHRCVHGSTTRQQPYNLRMRLHSNWGGATLALTNGDDRRGSKQVRDSKSMDDDDDNNDDDDKEEYRPHAKAKNHLRQAKKENEKCS